MDMLCQQRRGIAGITTVKLNAIKIGFERGDPTAHTFYESAPLHVNKARCKNGRRH
jgi:hypothetical protein